MTQEERDKLRGEIARHTKKFLAKGGVIEQIPQGVCKSYEFQDKRHYSLRTTKEEK